METCKYITKSIVLYPPLGLVIRIFENAPTWRTTFYTFRFEMDENISKKLCQNISFCSFLKFWILRILCVRLEKEAAKYCLFKLLTISQRVCFFLNYLQR